MNEPTTGAPRSPEAFTTPPEQQNPLLVRGLGSMRYLVIASIAMLAFGLLEIAYFYYGPLSVALTRAVIRGTGFTGATLVALSLFSSVLFKWHPKWAQYWLLRRYLGVAGALFGVVHAVTIVYIAGDGNLGIIFSNLNPIQNPLFFGFIAFVVLVIMLLTSTEWTVHKLGRNWKRIHRLIYIGFPALIFHAVLAHPAMLKTPPGYVLIAVTTVTVLGQLYWFFKIAGKKRFRSLGSLVGVIIIIVVAIIAYRAYT